MSPTLNDIARETRTSVSTVSRVLAGGRVAERISEETRTRVLRAASSMGYRPNLVARSLRTRKTHTIALLVSDIANPFFSRIASLVEQSLHRHGYSLVLCNSGEDPEREDEYLNLLPRKGIDGLILVPVVRGRKQITENLPAGLPLVILDRPVPGIAASVASDSDQAAAELCEQLRRAGVERVGLVSGPGAIVTHRRRSEVVVNVFEVVARREGPAQLETGHDAAEDFRNLAVDAVVCTNNLIGQGYIERMQLSPHPPIIGVFDEVPMMQQLAVPIVACAQDVPRLAEGCVSLLLPQLGAAAAPSRPILLPTHVVNNAAFRSRVKSV